MARLVFQEGPRAMTDRTASPPPPPPPRPPRPPAPTPAPPTRPTGPRPPRRPGLTTFSHWRSPASRFPPYPYPSGPRLRRSWAILEPVDFPKALRIDRLGDVFGWHSRKSPPRSRAPLRPLPAHASTAPLSVPPSSAATPSSMRAPASAAISASGRGHSVSAFSSTARARITARGHGSPVQAQIQCLEPQIAGQRRHR